MLNLRTRLWNVMNWHLLHILWSNNVFTIQFIKNVTSKLRIPDFLIMSMVSFCHTVCWTVASCLAISNFALTNSDWSYLSFLLAPWGKETGINCQLPTPWHNHCIVAFLWTILNIGNWPIRDLIKVKSHFSLPKFLIENENANG